MTKGTTLQLKFFNLKYSIMFTKEEEFYEVKSKKCQPFCTNLMVVGK